MAGRQLWVHGGGYFSYDSSDTWRETIRNGNRFDHFSFTETRRAIGFVELTDPSRGGLAVRLSAGRATIKGPNDGNFSPLNQGDWDPRRLFAYSGAATFRLGVSYLWKWFHDGIEEPPLREVQRGPGLIILLDPARDIQYRIDDTSVLRIGQDINEYVTTAGVWSDFGEFDR